jgi:hypothetical protein
VGLKSLKSLNLTDGYPNKNNKKKNNNNKVKSKPLELFELAGKNICTNMEGLTKMHFSMGMVMIKKSFHVSDPEVMLLYKSFGYEKNSWLAGLSTSNYHLDPKKIVLSYMMRKYPRT